jgi:hypothetical protein
MEYWLASGRAPQGVSGGVASLPLDTLTLRVEQERGQWLLRDGQRVLCNFGGHEPHARQALAVVQKYGFTQVALLGPGGEAMQVFVSRPSDAAHAAALAERTRAATHLASALAANAVPTNAITPQPVGPLKTTAPTEGLVTPVLALPRGASPERAHLGPGGINDLVQRQAFDWRQLKIQQDKGEWRLQVGTRPLASFGSDQFAARQALDALQYFRVTEQRQVGSASYFLCNGQAPRGTMPGTLGVVIPNEGLAASDASGRWAVAWNGQPLVACANAEEARRLLEAIKQHKFDRVCHFGGETGLTLMVRSH